MPNSDVEAPQKGAANLNAHEERHETDSMTAVELQPNRRMLYFSDGCMEELSDSEDECDADVPDKSLEVAIDENNLALAPRLIYKASKFGSNILAGIDYVGGGLASFLGISTPKYASEIEYYKRTMAEGDDGDENDNNRTWSRDEASCRNGLRAVITNDPKSTGYTQVVR